MPCVLVVLTIAGIIPIDVEMINMKKPRGPVKMIVNSTIKVIIDIISIL